MAPSGYALPRQTSGAATVGLGAWVKGATFRVADNGSRRRYGAPGEDGIPGEPLTSAVERSLTGSELPAYPVLQTLAEGGVGTITPIGPGQINASAPANDARVT